MQSAKEAYMALVKGEHADFIPETYGTVKTLVFPGERYIDLEHFDPYGTGPDAWGVLWTNRGPNPVVDGNMVAKNFRLFDSMEDWKENVKFPPVDYMPVKDILNGMAVGMGYNPDEHLKEVLLLSGPFERMNQMVGMEEALVSFYTCPDEVHEFLDAMCEYKLHCIDLAYEAVHPEIICMHDDWGHERNMMFSPEIWREFIKPLEKKFAEKIHSYGMIYNHHSCGHIEQIVPDLVEIGVDIINPVMVTNDVKGLLKKYGDKICFAGGYDVRTLDGDSTPEERFAEIKRGFDEYLPLGRWIPYYIPSVEARWFEYMGIINELGRKYSK